MRLLSIRLFDPVINFPGKLQVRKRKLENVTVGKASLPIPFGTHHTKLTIFESDDSLHVLISTANLLQSQLINPIHAFDLFRSIV